MARWEIEWLVQTEANERSVPAFEFLRACPRTVRLQLLAIVDAVTTIGPDQWRDRNTHCPTKGAIKDLHEARDKRGQMLYRLFLLWQRQERRVIIIDGREKPNRTALPQKDYDEIAEMAVTVDQTPPPLAVADDFARAVLEED